MTKKTYLVIASFLLGMISLAFADQKAYEALIMAVHNSSIPSIELALKNGANINVTEEVIAESLNPWIGEGDYSSYIQSKYFPMFGRTALHIAYETGNEDVIAKLINSGADTQLLDKLGRTPEKCWLSEEARMLLSDI